MTESTLIRTVWDGEAFRPASGFFSRKATDAFGAGEIVMMEAVTERSMRSHRHYFAAIHDAWANLPERLADMPYAVSADALRKHALIKSGFAESTSVDAGSNAAALRVAAIVRAVHCDYCVVQVRGHVVLIFTAQSQSVKAMGQKEFQRSKQAVLDYLEGLLRGEAA